MAFDAKYKVVIKAHSMHLVFRQIVCKILQVYRQACTALSGTFPYLVCLSCSLPSASSHFPSTASSSHSLSRRFFFREYISKCNLHRTHCCNRISIVFSAALHPPRTPLTAIDSIPLQFSVGIFLGLPITFVISSNLCS